MSAELHKKESGYFYIEGTVRIGGKSERLRETTGCRDEAAARRVFTQRLAEVERQLLLGEDPRKVRTAMPDFPTAAADYLETKPGLGNQDRSKLLQLGEFFAGTPVDKLGAQEWEKFVSARLGPCTPSTVRRWFAMFLPPMRRISERLKFQLPMYALPAEGKGREIYLEPADRDELLAAYPEHAKLVALMLCLQGCRHFEALRLDWQDISFSRGTLTFRITKNGEIRVVPIHPEVRTGLERLHLERSTGPVFLTPAGDPYTDRRKASHGDGKDGSGIRRAHASAMRRYTVNSLMKQQETCRTCGCELVREAGLPNSATVQFIRLPAMGGTEEPTNYKLACRLCDKTKRPAQRPRLNWFRIHDWRHHWASWFIMDGGNAPSLMALGGWKNPKMVQRYVKLAIAHLRKQVDQSQRRTA
jgi:integrase